MQDWPPRAACGKGVSAEASVHEAEHPAGSTDKIRPAVAYAKGYRQELSRIILG